MVGGIDMSPETGGVRVFEEALKRVPTWLIEAALLAAVIVVTVQRFVLGVISACG